MTHWYEKTVPQLSRGMRHLSSAAVIAMLILTCADIVMRFFQKPILGTYDIVSFLGAVVFSFGLAHTTLEKGHVAVSFVVDRCPSRVRAGIRTVTNLLALALFSAISWQSFLYALELQQSGEVSPSIQLPFYPIVYGIGFATGVVCLVLIIDLSQNLAKVFSK